MGRLILTKVGKQLTHLDITTLLRLNKNMKLPKNMICGSLSVIGLK